MYGNNEAITAPSPIKKVWVAKPVVLCDGGSLSPTNARKGSMEILMDASSTHNNVAAIQSTVDCGIKKALLMKELPQ